MHKPGSTSRGGVTRYARRPFSVILFHAAIAACGIVSSYPSQAGVPVSDTEDRHDEDSPPCALAVTSISPDSTGLVGAGTMAFTVVFSDDVTGFDAESDLVFFHYNTSHAKATVAGAGKEYTVVVDGIEGAGGFALTVSAGETIHNASGDSLVTSAVSPPVTVVHAEPPAYFAVVPSTGHSDYTTSNSV